MAGWQVNEEIMGTMHVQGGRPLWVVNIGSVRRVTPENLLQPAIDVRRDMLVCDIGWQRRREQVNNAETLLC